MPVNNCIVIELDVAFRDVVPAINNHKQAVEVDMKCGAACGNMAFLCCDLV